jgi:hypothetical protein
MACQLDAGELEAAFSLANVLIGPRARFAEGFFYLRRAISAIPEAIRSGGVAPDVARSVIRLLQMIVQRAEDPIALMAAWSYGNDREPVLKMSSVDLKKVQSFERLADLVSAGFFIALLLTPELPDDEPTILQRLLTAGSPGHTASPTVSSGSRPHTQAHARLALPSVATGRVPGAAERSTSGAARAASAD